MFERPEPKGPFQFNRAWWQSLVTATLAGQDATLAGDQSFALPPPAVWLNRFPAQGSFILGIPQGGAVSPDRWLLALSEPVRLKQGFAAALHLIPAIAGP